jgi:hypothetical protein
VILPNSFLPKVRPPLYFYFLLLSYLAEPVKWCRSIPRLRSVRSRIHSKSTWRLSWRLRTASTRLSGEALASKRFHTSTGGSPDDLWPSEGSKARPRPLNSLRQGHGLHDVLIGVRSLNQVLYVTNNSLAIMSLLTVRGV